MAQNIVTVSQSDNEVTVSQTPRTTVTVTSAGIQGPQGPQGEGTAEVEALNIFSGSIQIEVDNLTAATGSYLTEVPSGTISGSAQITAFGFISESVDITPLNNFSGSIQTEVDNLTSKTGSYATTGSNSFSGDQNVDGNLTITGNLTANQYIVSSSVTFLTQSFSSGSTIFGDTSDDTHQFTGSVNITGSFRLNNYNLPELDGTAEQIIITDGAGNLTFDLLRTVYEQVKNVSGTTLQKGTPVHVTGSVGNENTVIAASASDASTMPATFILNETLADDQAGLGIAIGFINGVNTSDFTEGDVVYVGESGGYTNVQPTGSNLIQNLGIVTKAAVNGSGVVLGAGRTNAVPNLLNGEVFFGENNRAITKAISEIFSEASYVYSGSFSGSFEGDGSNLTGIVTDLTPLNTFTGSIQTEVDNLTAATSSYLTEVPSGTISGSAQITAFGFISESVDITPLNNFSGSIQTEVDNLTAATGSYLTEVPSGTISGSAQITAFGFISESVDISSLNTFSGSIQTEVDSIKAVTGSFATTGSNNFVGDQVITGSLTISGSSTFTNIGPAVFSGSLNAQQITAPTASIDNIETTDGSFIVNKIFDSDLFVVCGLSDLNNLTSWGSDNVIIGGPRTDPGTSLQLYNTYVGSDAGRNFLSPAYVTAVGSEALGHYSPTQHSNNTAVGARAGYGVKGNNTTIVGSQALYTTGVANTTVGEEGVFIGYRSGYDAVQPTSGGNFLGNNVAIGYQTMYRSYLSSSIAIGYQSNYSAADAENRKGSLVTLVGPYTNVSQSVNIINATGIGANVEVQQSNTVILGNNADVGIGTTTPTAKLEVSGSTLLDGTLNITGITSGSIFSGSFVGDGSGLTGIGVDTSAFATTGSNNFVGDQVITGSLTISGSSTFTNIGPAVFSGSIRIADRQLLTKLSAPALDFRNDVSYGIAVTDALGPDTTGLGNIVIGGPFSTNTVIGSGNTIIGTEVLDGTDNPNRNVAIGTAVLGGTFAAPSFFDEVDDNVVIGYQAGKFIGPYQSVIIGSQAGFVSSTNKRDIGRDSVFIGYNSAYKLGESNYVVDGLGKNVAVGSEAMIYSYLSSSIAIGYHSNYAAAAGEERRGSLVTLVGPYTNVSQSVNLINATAIGANVEVQQSNTVILGNNADVGIGTTTPTAKLEVSGSVVISEILTLEPTHPAPTSAPSGSIISSGSGAELKPYFWNGSTWTSMI